MSQISLVRLGFEAMCRLVKKARCKACDGGRTEAYGSVRWSEAAEHNEAPGISLCQTETCAGGSKASSCEARENGRAEA